MITEQLLRLSEIYRGPFIRGALLLENNYTVLHSIMNNGIMYRHLIGASMIFTYT